MTAATAGATEIHLKLGDLVAGGDGCGAKSTLGINPRDGKPSGATTFAGSGSGVPAFKVCDGTGGTANYPLVDGVMTVNGVSVIDSLGGTFGFPVTGSASSWDAVRNNVALIDSGAIATVIQLNDQPGVNRSGIGIHASAGVTFDLAAIRAAYSGATTLRVEGVAGLNYESCVNANVEIFAIVDGVARYQNSFLSGGDHQPFSFTLNASDRFLTLACTDQNQSNGCDHGVIADAILVIDAPVSDCDANFVVDACEIANGLANDCNGNGEPDPCDFEFVPYGTGCPGLGGFVPTLSMYGCVNAGSTVFLFVDKGLGGASGLVLLGLERAAIPLIASGGCSLNVKTLLPVSLPIVLGGSGPGKGNYTLFHSIPADVGVLGGTLRLQCFVFDSSAPADFSNTAGLELQIH